MRLLFAATLFLSAALIFVAQPMFGKMVLPHVGATPAAWTTCVLGFQAALLLGYAYAHFVRVPPLVHVAFLLVPLATLPVGLVAGTAPPAGGNPTLWLLARLVASLGAPFVALAASAPVLQRWVRGTPYGLYAASNAGSLAALLAYPFVIEPALPLARQARWFSCGYGVFVVLALACALCARGPLEAAAPTPTQVESRGTVARWVGLAFVPSSLMLGATTFIATDLASLPLLWVVPLALYLVSFIVGFARRRAYPSPVVLAGLVALLLPLFFLSIARVSSSPTLILMHLGFLLLTGIVFHGELARVAPPPAQLTRFYLALAAGGALGGLWNALAPFLFDGITEYPITMALACLLLPRAPAPTSGAGERERELLRSVGIDPGAVAGLAPSAGADAGRQRRLDVWVPVATTVFALAAGLALRGAGQATRALVALALPIVACALLSVRRRTRLALGLAGVLVASGLGAGDSSGVRFRARSFFGVLRVEDQDGVRSLIHGTIVHGQQSLDARLSREPTAYYHRNGPAGQIFAALRAARAGQAAEVAVVGLGTGTLAAYGQPGDRFTFYEIDAMVERIARDARLFTWLADSRAAVDVVLGDARLALAAAAPGRYHLLVVDAFSSHAIPMHLVTREALALYLSRCAPHALLALHVSSRHVRLDEPVGALARDAGLAGLIRRDHAPASVLETPSAWIVLARTPADLGPLASDERWRPLPAGGRAWTDDFSDLLGAIDW